MGDNQKTMSASKDSINRFTYFQMGQGNETDEDVELLEQEIESVLKRQGFESAFGGTRGQPRLQNGF